MKTEVHFTQDPHQRRLIYQRKHFTLIRLRSEANMHGCTLKSQFRSWIPCHIPQSLTQSVLVAVPACQEADFTKCVMLLHQRMH